MIRASVLLVLLFSPLAPAHASSSASANADASDGTEQLFSNDSGPNSAAAGIAVGPGAADAAAYAAEGVMAASAFNTRTATSTANADATATWTDTFTVNKSGFGGQHAQMTIVVELEGFLDPLGGTRSFLSHTLQFSGTTIGFTNRIQVGYTGAEQNAGDFPGFISGALEPGGFSWLPGSPFFISTLRVISFSFTMGQPVTITGSLSTSASTDLFGGGGSADVNFFNTSRWKGVTSLAAVDPVSEELVDLDLADVDFASTSGADYRYEIVPEPDGGSFAALVALVAIAVGFNRRMGARSS